MTPQARAARLAALRLRLSGWCESRWRDARVARAVRTRLVHAIRRLEREQAAVAAGRPPGAWIDTPHPHPCRR